MAKPCPSPASSAVARPSTRTEDVELPLGGAFVVTEDTTGAIAAFGAPGGYPAAISGSQIHSRVKMSLVTRR